MVIVRADNNYSVLMLINSYENHWTIADSFSVYINLNRIHLKVQNQMLCLVLQVFKKLTF